MNSESCPLIDAMSVRKSLLSRRLMMMYDVTTPVQAALNTPPRTLDAMLWCSRLRLSPCIRADTMQQSMTDNALQVTMGALQSHTTANA